VHADPARVRFVGFGAFSLDLEIFAYIETADWAEFLAIREDLLLRIMEIVEATGSGFAFPSQTLYLGKDDGLDDSRSRAAEARVREWRDRHELPLPDPTPEAIREADDSLAYPPEGSVARKA
jgi:MscS family membrane protein